ncbi:MAG: FAD-binding protein [Bacteroidetes bacterium]|nr:FAD-binding protein [Bacteroidota bacterium]
MIRQIELVLLPEEAADKTIQLKKASEILGIPDSAITFLKPLKRSIDARSRQIKIRLKVEAWSGDDIPSSGKTMAGHFHFDRQVNGKKPVMIIGAGPAGLFAALRLIELGLKPVIIERGKDVQNRRRDLAAINRLLVINPDSNYCFGEGGAGAYSDGKLYTRSTKRGDVKRILDILVFHGASEDILVDAHPHIGTNKLPKIIVAIRETILNAGGEIHFNTRLKDLVIRDHRIKGIITEKTPDGPESELDADAVILATGHSARDIYELLYRKNILIQAKPFALGVRIEHPQHIIDSIQYHCKTRSAYLPPASYQITHRLKDRSVYSFCMCPGGIIAPAATANNEIVVNGWSPSKRNNAFANSGMVVSLNEKDFLDYKKDGPLAALRYQQQVEQLAFLKGGKNLHAPTQRLVDFTENKFSTNLPPVSYQPGVTSVQLHEVLPPVIYGALKEALKTIGKKMKPYFTNEAVLVATESRTSSPVRIPRNDATLQHPEVAGLFPCGEGAGFAGGIVSAAIDGERCAGQTFLWINSN